MNIFQPYINHVFIGVGSNLGDRRAMLAAAIDKLEESETIGVVQKSPLYETEPVGYHEQPKFLNQVLEIDTSLTPEKLLRHLLSIEQELGRARRQRWGPRTIDLDLLAYNQLQIASAGLTVPHPEVHRRAFVLQPWYDIAPDFQVVGHDLTVAELLARCSDQSAVIRLD